MAEYLTTDTELTTIADAIRAKGGTTAPLVYPDEFVTAINAISGGTKSAPERDVNLIDWDGTILYSYSQADFLALTALPENPDRTADGLTAQGWNWTLADAKAYIQAHDILYIWQTYASDGKTLIAVDLQPNMLAPYFCIRYNGTVSIDWGDGTTPTTGAQSMATNAYFQHTYTEPGRHIITIDAADAQLRLEGYNAGNNNYYCTLLLAQSSQNGYDSAYRNTIKAVFLGTNSQISNGFLADCASLFAVYIQGGLLSNASYVFEDCNSLRAVYLPDDITNATMSYTFRNCHNLRFINVPSCIKSIGSNAFRYCVSLTEMIIQDGVTSIGIYAFQFCAGLTEITIPDSVTTIDISAFERCTHLSSVSIGNGVTSIGAYAFSNCFCYGHGTSSLIIPASVTSIGNNAFTGCALLASITILGSIASIGDATFQNCSFLSSISIHEGPISIGAYAFGNCMSLEEITIPASVTSIANYAFSNCRKLLAYHLKSTTPPSISFNSFNRIAGIKIYIPAGTYEAYSTATNWTTLASYLEEES